MFQWNWIKVNYNSVYFQTTCARTSILWNHFYLWEPMFVDSQNYDGSCGFNFMGNWFVVFQCKAIHYFVKRSWGRIFVGKVYSRNPRTLNPTNNDDSTVHQNVELYRKSGEGGCFPSSIWKKDFDKTCLCRIKHAKTKLTSFLPMHCNFGGSFAWLIMHFVVF